MIFLDMNKIWPYHWERPNKGHADWACSGWSWGTTATCSTHFMQYKHVIWGFSIKPRSENSILGSKSDIFKSQNIFFCFLSVKNIFKKRDYFQIQFSASLQYFLDHTTSYSRNLDNFSTPKWMQVQKNIL